MPHTSVSDELIATWIAGVKKCGCNRKGCEHEIMPQEIGYIKGSARMTTALALCSMFLQKDVDMQRVLPHVASSLQCIYVTQPHCRTVRDELVMNFKVSHRGQIREAPNVFTWIGTLKNMSTHGVQDASEIVRFWNSQVSRANEVRGAKATVIKAMLEKCPAQSLTSCLLLSVNVATTSSPSRKQRSIRRNSTLDFSSDTPARDGRF